MSGQKPTLSTTTRFGAHVPSVIGVGRRGTLEKAKRTGKARAHKYWAISKWHDDGVVAGPVPDEAHGKFKTKQAAQEYLESLLSRLQGVYEHQHQLEGATMSNQPPQTHPVGMQPLIAYQVGDYDIVAAFDPEGAIAVLCEQTGQDRSEFDLSDVELVSDKHLDSLEVFNQDEGKAERLETTLRQDVAALTQPAYMYGWE